MNPIEQKSEGLENGYRLATSGWFKAMHINYYDIVKTSNDTVNDTVFTLIKDNNKITATKISEQLKMSFSSVKRKIKELKIATGWNAFEAIKLVTGK